MPFYKVENNTLISATNIEGLDFSLNEISKDEYTYPVAGWLWFADRAAAITATGIQEIPEPVSETEIE